MPGEELYLVNASEAYAAKQLCHRSLQSWYLLRKRWKVVHDRKLNSNFWAHSWCLLRDLFVVFFMAHLVMLLSGCRCKQNMELVSALLIEDFEVILNFNGILILWEDFALISISYYIYHIRSLRACCCVLPLMLWFLIIMLPIKCSLSVIYVYNRICNPPLSMSSVKGVFARLGWAWKAIYDIKLVYLFIFYFIC